MIGRFPHPHVAHDVLDLDDGIVDENAGAERDRQKAHEVEREPKHVHHPERGKDGQRQRNRDDHRRPQVAQEQQHDDDGQRRAFEQRIDGRLIIARGEVDRGVDQLEIDVGIGCS